ncbi:LacI family DNA-binding transcriptional regulator [Micromonospora inositola]|uniref:Transcriptional regulator, LacI family n=1 Tax=Micromonospora inositola TaxID=47865 RepID=A0A1C5JNM5_9ACTN|nr:LacI family DNA-binding transcriptional regulator [Micromonospora inositola]SCG71809.1 transcriptional regulator, LacI family [Micromonospora inositola]
MNKRVTLRDVAKFTGVHVSTVSRVLRGDDERVSQETAARIVAAAKELGFHRDRWAASLRSGKTGVIGVLVPRITDIVLATVFEGIDAAASAAGYQAVVSSTWDDDEARAVRIRRFIAERVDGLIIADARRTDPALARLAAEQVPFILVSRASRGFPSVTGRDRFGGRLAADHLIDIGCRRLAVVAGPGHASTSADRVAGFLAAAKTRGVEVDPRLVVPSTFDVPGGASAMARVLAAGRPDGVFAVNDFAAIGAMGTLRDHGLRVGREVAVVGYNDIDVDAQLLVPLTSIRTPLGEMGSRALHGMLTLLASGNAESVRLTPELVVRSTTGNFSPAAVTTIG